MTDAHTEVAKIICTKLCGDVCVLVHDPERATCNDENCRVWPVVNAALAAAQAGASNVTGVEADRERACAFAVSRGMRTVDEDALVRMLATHRIDSFAAEIKAAADCIRRGWLTFRTFGEAEQAIRILRPPEPVGAPSEEEQ